ncbi:MAG TPA: cobaltochelatase subunit CobT [Rhodospirillaceae bacterium]|nr:cobaltochelatase subunit CobT [Rhodospirillaceae bacterium]
MERQSQSGHRASGAEEAPTDLVKRVTASALRSIAGRPDVVVAYASGLPGVRGDQVRLPPPPSQMHLEDLSRLRGAADAVALRLRFHDDALHARLMPNSQEGKDIFNSVAQARVEALGGRLMKGVAQNLTAALEARCRAEGFAAISERDQMPLSEAVRLMAREYCTGFSVPQAASQAVDLWRQHIESKAGPELAALGGLVTDQTAFSQQLRAVIAALEVEPFDQNDSSSQKQDQSAPSEQDEGGARQQSSEAEGSGPIDDSGEAAFGELDGATTPEGDGLDGSPLPVQSGDEAGGASKSSPGDLDRQPAEKAYHAFTQAFDQVIDAADLCESDELLRLRQQLDQQLGHLQGVVSRLANRLQRRLMAKQTRAWAFDLEEGQLDSGRLARVVSNPMHSLSFKQEKDTDFRDTVVSLLIDNSGSMRGRPITVAAMSADILARTLERCGVKVEVLGFTTRAWKGGDSREKWVAAGKPADPGRLNDLRHIVYKAADTPWRRARKSLGLMLREGILKENIDGEALLWAHARLLARAEQRRILMVISDGAPVDDSTLSVNPGSYLERHLRQVISWIEAVSPVELVAIGIGHDVTRYYRRAVTIMDAEELGGTMLSQLTSLFEEASGAFRPGRPDPWPEISPVAGPAKHRLRGRAKA